MGAKKRATIERLGLCASEQQRKGKPLHEEKVNRLLPSNFTHHSPESRGRQRLSQSTYLMNGLELQPVQAELRVALSHLHAQHRLSVQQVVEGTLAGAGTQQQEASGSLVLHLCAGTPEDSPSYGELTPHLF